MHCGALSMIFFHLSQKLYMVAKLGQGSSHMVPVQSVSDSDLMSPSTYLASDSGQSSVSPWKFRRKSSASSIIDDASLESESDEESGLAMMTLNPRFRSDSVQTSGSSTQSFENKTKDVEAEEKGANARRRSQTDIMTSEEERARQVAAMAKVRSESLGKIARSPSAPEKERPRVVDTSSLSRSSSAPQGPTPEQASSLREGIVMMRRAEEQEASASSSSLSLNDSGGDPDMPSRKISGDHPTLPEAEQQPESDSQSTDQLSTSEQDSSTEQETCQFSSVIEDSEQEHSDGEQKLEQELGLSFDAAEEGASAEVASNAENLAETAPEYPAPQCITDVFEPRVRSSDAQRQTPHIKSPLIAQHKIESAITQPEPPRKRSSLPKRSSPVMTKKTRPDFLYRSHGNSDSDLNGILQKLRDSTTLADSGDASLSSSHARNSKTAATKRSSETFPRSPVKPDKSHYPSSLDLTEFPHKKEKSSCSLSSSSSFLASRKKSMSLSDLLNIGREVTSGRRKDKDSRNDNNAHQKSSDQLSPLSPSTDEDPISPTNTKESRKEEKKSRFSRLRRKTSRSDIKDGIASGPDLDPKRASRHFFKESLMLDSS